MEKSLIPASEIHSYLLEILKSIDAFCVANGIRYSLAYGSLIGAVRHKGFIPWDDDIDLLMPRPDFERFVKEYKDERYECIFQRPYFQHIYAKVHDSWTELKGIGHHKYGLYVDIFPVDGKPEELQTRQWMERKLTHYAHRLNICSTHFNLFNCHQPLFANINAHLRGPEYFVRAAEKIMSCYPWESCRKAGAVSMTRNGTKEVFDRELFEHYTTLEFEGCQFQVFEDWETFLKQQYGDYMQLPPLKDRRTHGIIAYKIH